MNAFCLLLGLFVEFYIMVLKTVHEIHGTSLFTRLNIAKLVLIVLQIGVYENKGCLLFYSHMYCKEFHVIL